MLGSSRKSSEPLLFKEKLRENFEDYNQDLNEKNEKNEQNNEFKKIQKFDKNEKPDKNEKKINNFFKISNKKPQIYRKLKLESREKIINGENEIELSSREGLFRTKLPKEKFLNIMIKNTNNSQEYK